MGTISFGYPSVIVASTLAKTPFLKYMGLGDDSGIFPGKEGMAGTITGLFQVSGSLHEESGDSALMVECPQVDAVIGIICG